MRVQPRLEFARLVLQRPAVCIYLQGTGLGCHSTQLKSFVVLHPITAPVPPCTFPVHATTPGGTCGTVRQSLVHFVISEQKAGTRGNIGHLRRPGKPSGSQDPTMWYIATRPALRAQGKKGVRSFPHGLAIPDTGSIG